jgi:hypothetical protein
MLQQLQEMLAVLAGSMTMHASKLMCMLCKRRGAS